MASMSARLGGVLAPLILELASIHAALPLLVFGSLSVLAATLAFLLPETAGKPLPQMLRDADTGPGLYARCTRLARILIEEKEPNG